MKKSRLIEKPSRLTSPFDTTSHETERTANQKFVGWTDRIGKNKNSRTRFGQETCCY